MPTNWVNVLWHKYKNIGWNEGMMKALNEKKYIAKAIHAHVCELNFLTKSKKPRCQHHECLECLHELNNFKRLFNLQELLEIFHFKIRLYFRTTKSNFCFKGTEYKGVDDDSRYGGANYKAENHIYSEAGCKGDGDSEHSLQSDGQQQDETSTVPCGERRAGVDMI